MSGRSFEYEHLAGVSGTSDLYFLTFLSFLYQFLGGLTQLVCNISRGDKEVYNIPGCLPSVLFWEHGCLR